jgi:tRNA1(Val) A37 N6-methylase TrmN6
VAPDAITTDSLYGGALSLRQPASGYRMNIDALLLADFAAQGRYSERALDLGAGVGSVSLALQHLGAASRFELLERESALIALAEENTSGAKMSARAWCCDLALGLPEALRRSAELVVSNPPFFDPESSRVAPDPNKARARFGELSPFLTAAAEGMSGARARAAFVYPARELSRFLAQAEAEQLVAKRLRFVHADAATTARVALIELRRGKPGGLDILPPLYEWAAPGTRTAELSRIVAGQRAQR